MKLNMVNVEKWLVNVEWGALRYDFGSVGLCD